MANKFNKLDNKFVQSVFPDASDEQIQKLMERYEESLASANAKLDSEVRGLKSQLEDANSQIDEAGKQMEQANKQIEEFKSLDVNSIKAVAEKWESKAGEWKTKLEEAKKESEEKFKAFRYETAVKDCATNLKFSSNAARKAFLADALQSNLPYESDTIFGFDDFVEKYKETDPDAFFTEKTPEQGEIDFRGLPVGATRSVIQQNQEEYVCEAERAYAARGIKFNPACIV